MAGLVPAIHAAPRLRALVIERLIQVSSTWIRFKDLASYAKLAWLWRSLPKSLRRSGPGSLRHSGARRSGLYRCPRGAAGHRAAPACFPLLPSL
jgi:hypothetical protein